MNPLFSSFLYIALRQRIQCSLCGAVEHHRWLGRNKFLCKSCHREFTLVPEQHQEEQEEKDDW